MSGIPSLERPSLSAPAREPLAVPEAEVLQLAWEQAGTRGEELMPAGLAPTSPTLVTLLVIRAPAGPLAPWTLAQLRLSCRSGARARAYVVQQALDTDDATARTLAAGWGIGGRRRPVRLDRGYDAVRASTEGAEVLLLDPAPINPGDVQYVTNLHPVRVEAGERLAQVELDLDAARTERGRPILVGFDAEAWGEPRLSPRHPVAGTFAVGTLTLPVVRFLLRPDVPPHAGTEPIGTEPIG